MVAAFTPWNFPVLTRPARSAPRSRPAARSSSRPRKRRRARASRWYAALSMPGCQRACCNLVFGVPAEVSEHLMTKDAVRKVSFTGSIPVGKQLAALAAKGMKRTTMELGGHSPVVVFDDADPRRPPTPSRRSSIATPARSASRRRGSTCRKTSIRASSSASRSTPTASSSATGWKRAPRWARSPTRGVSTPWKPSSPTPRDAAARSQTGGERGGNKGYFFKPTVITNIPDDSKIMTQEPFGPVAPIVAFKTFDEVVERANSLEFGLAAYAFTTSNSTAAAIGDGSTPAWSA